jgi:hypothetical protein
MQLLNPQAWSPVVPLRSDREAVESSLPPEWLRDGIRVVEVATFQPLRNQPSVPPLEVGVEPNATERSLLVARFPSGAVEFYLPEEIVSGTAEPGLAESQLERFRVELPVSSIVRRGLVDQALQLVLLRISGQLVDALARRGLPVAARRLESWIWRRAKLREGWHRVQFAGGEPELQRAVPQPERGRVLLLLHGTFSSTRASFGGLFNRQEWGDLERLYPGGVFGFEHFSFSRALAENLQLLGHELAAGEEEQKRRPPSRSETSQRLSCPAEDMHAPRIAADVVAFSRGGLLARLLLEQPWFEVGRLVLCATPNRGTPLASGQRWRESLGWLANLLELCPDHSLIDGAELIANGAIWLATRLTSDLPGLVEMHPEAALLRQLGEAKPAVDSCMVLAANYRPEGNALERLIDLGSDRFFTEPNDLVVPARGAWDLGVGNAWLPDGAIACFGPGGNLRMAAGNVQHLNLLRQPECGGLVLRALRGEPLGIAAFERTRLVTQRHLAPGPLAPAGTHSLLSPDRSAPLGLSDPLLRTSHHAEPAMETGFATQTRPAQVERLLQIMILGRPESLELPATKWKPERRRGGEAIILATYGGARVFQPFSLSGRQGDTLAGRRFQRIITIHEKINERLEGRRDRLPSARELRELGANLFSTLFSGPVKSLYDVARTEQGSERLNIVITCSIPWLAGKPWELAWDPLRRKFLATEDVHLVRSVFTAVPAERPPREQRPLRILIVEAQPSDAAFLAIEVERKRIAHRFRDLVAAGAAELSVLVGARPETLHDRLLEGTLRGRPFDIVHFIGHGDFDRDSREGCLLMLGDAAGRAVAVGVQTLRELLCHRGLQLVFLNACDTARQPGARDRGLAQSLVEAGLPAVVANQFPVLDPSAVAFAERFYWGLAQGSSLAAAAREARIAVNYSAEREAIDWAVPVLYARDPDEVLCRPPLRRLEPLAGPRSTVLPHGSARTSRAARVGVADFARDFAELEEVLRRMNAAQDYFEFRSVRVNVPIDVWRRERDTASGRERTFLVANELGAQLRDDVVRLGVDYLACVTNTWVSESAGGDQSLLGWWSDERDCPVFVLSTAGLGIGDDPALLHRVIASEFAVCCGGHLHDAYTDSDVGIAHLDGPMDSLFRYDPERTAATILGSLRIYEPQRTQLFTAIPRRLEREKLVRAIEQLLL